jgi:HEAT repeat protein
MPGKSKKPSITFENVLKALLDKGKPFSPKFLHQFSDISEEDLESIKKIWDQIDTARRVSLLEDLEDLMESDSVLSFNDLAQLALNDADPKARAAGIRLLWECDDRRLIPVFIKIMVEDEDELVRASAAAALGLFVYIGELDHLPEKIKNLVVDSLLTVMRGSDTALVRRRTLESLGFSGNDAIPPLIEEAFSSNDDQWMASALFAMGRSADERWESNILKTLANPSPDVQVEAIRAAGQLELDSALEPLLEMLREPENVDDDIKAAVVWSLSQIGGDEVRVVLNKLLEDIEDDDEADYIEMAIDNLKVFDENDPFGKFAGIQYTPGEDDLTIIDVTKNPDEDEADLPRKKKSRH